MLQRRLAAARDGATGRNGSSAEWWLVTAAGIHGLGIHRIEQLDRSALHDCRPVRVDGRWNLLQRRVAPARNGAAERRGDVACALDWWIVAGADGIRFGQLDRSTLHDSQPVRLDGRRNVLQRRVAATRHVSPSRKCASAIWIVPAGLVRHRVSDSWRVHNARSVHQHS